MLRIHMIAATLNNGAAHLERLGIIAQVKRRISNPLHQLDGVCLFFGMRFLKLAAQARQERVGNT